MNGFQIVDKRRKPFFLINKQIFEDVRITKSAQISVYAVLCKYAGNESRESWASIPTIAENARCSLSVARRSLNELQEFGYIQKSAHFHNGKQTSNRYLILD